MKEEITIHDIHKMEKSAERDAHESLIARRGDIIEAINYEIEQNVRVFWDGGNERVNLDSAYTEPIEKDMDFYLNEFEPRGFTIVPNLHLNKNSYPVETILYFYVTRFTPKELKEKKKPKTVVEYFLDLFEALLFCVEYSLDLFEALLL